MFKVLNLVCPDKSDIKYKIVKFSDGQVQFTLDDPTPFGEHDYIEIKSRMSWDDVQVILAATAVLREASAGMICLTIPYFLGARSDRKFTKGGVNYLREVIGPLINEQEYDDIEVLDAHSDVVEACLHNYTKKDNVELVEWSLNQIYPHVYDTDPYVLVSPDAGALKKMYNVAEKIVYEGEIVTASKHRDIATGKIISTEVPLHMQYAGKDFIIIDDICDGGRTFIEIAKVIKKTFPSAKIYLIVTHGIFSAGYKELAKYFTNVFCTNSVKDINDSVIYADDITRGFLHELSPSGFIKQLNVF